MKTAWVFPGQGSQKIGMGQDVIDLKDAKERFQYASDIFEKDLFGICQTISDNESMELDLNNTKNTQICLFLVESILLDALKNNGHEPNFVAGHSLGEISALYAGNVLSFQDCVSLIKFRSELMANAAEGSMAAIIGFDRQELDSLILGIDNLVIANDNSSSQVVLSGSKNSLDEISKSIKCKRFISLNVSGAFHSHFMEEPSNQFSKYLDNITFNKSTYKIISNSNPTFSDKSQEIKDRLKNQMCNGVRWRETMDLMGKQDDKLHLIEIGPSNVLGGLAKRHLKNVLITQVSSSGMIF
tara:strand:- start:182 stop:1078 length:897 start_codon:yes stop_codon:yes gene_type:complete